MKQGIFFFSGAKRLNQRNLHNKYPNYLIVETKTKDQEESGLGTFIFIAIEGRKCKGIEQYCDRKLNSFTTGNSHS